MTSDFPDHEWKSVLFGTTPNVVIGQRLGISYVRSQQEQLTINVREQVITVSQSTMGLTAIPGVVWDAALLMIDYLVYEYRQERQLFLNKVLDLGCGTGVIGIAACLLGANYVLFSDGYSSSSILEENIASSLPEELQSKTKFVSHKWENEELPSELLRNNGIFKLCSDPAENSVYGCNVSESSDHLARQLSVWDTIICSDLFYDEKMLPPLLSTLRKLSFRRLLIGYKKRHDEPEEKFFMALSEWCSLSIVPIESIELINCSPSAARSELYIIIAVPYCT